MAYHVTLASNLQSILENGLIPMIGRNSQNLGEIEKRIYFFINREEMHNALMNWFGEIYEESEDGLIIIEVDDIWLHVEKDSNGCTMFECYSYKIISSDKIINIFTEDYKKIKFR